ncbi:hypothetical protein NC651_020623 [Populus alba x Populus x berolinensis]|nr:hypothetical protein NC651_020623 [Populus alba x Populus x berolinensis]
MLGATQFLHIPGLELSCPLDALQVWNPVDLLPVFGGVQTCDPREMMAAMCDVLATETAIIYGLEPVWGSGFTWFLLGERMGAAPVLGKMWKPEGAYIWIIFSVVSGKYEKRSEKGDHLLVSDE